MTIYFLRGQNSGAIKIGYTGASLTGRVNSIRTSSSEPIEILGAIPGDRLSEEKLHDEFADIKIRGEWFKSSPELLLRIDALVSRYPDHDAEECAVADDEYTKLAAKWLAEIEDGEARRNGCRVQEIRGALSQKLGLPAGFLENYRRGRIRVPIAACRFEAIKREYIEECQRQIAEAKEILRTAL